MNIRWFSRRRRNNPPTLPYPTNAPHRATGSHRPNTPHRATRSNHATGPHHTTGPSRVNTSHRPAPHRAQPRNLPTWMTQPTLADPRPGRAGWLTPAQQWRANGGHW
uniref:Uncharacterized protein n=1 Tax=Salinispora arenicola (strain CNS-205) TaxID=391037 RepID=A8LVC9_SALAI